MDAHCTLYIVSACDGNSFPLIKSSTQLPPTPTHYKGICILGESIYALAYTLLVYYIDKQVNGQLIKYKSACCRCAADANNINSRS